MRSRSPAGRCRIWLSRPLPRGARPGSLAPPLLLLGLILVWSGCGIPEYPGFLAQPRRLDPLVEAFRFQGTAANIEDGFLGFELYYKIYEAGSLAPAADQAAIVVFEDLAGRAFRRIHRPTDELGQLQKPLIVIVDAALPRDYRGLEFEVTVDFSEDLSLPQFPRIQVVDVPDPFAVDDIRRGVRYQEIGQTNLFKTFAEFLPTDADVSTAVWQDIDAGFPPVILVLYVLSYGRDPVDKWELHSRPLYLGQINITFPP